jgi:hypothetical protein
MRAPVEYYTSSRGKTFRACMRRHKHEYVQGYRARVPQHALRFGTATHAGLEAWMDWENAPPEHATRLDAAFAALPADLDPVDLVRVEVMLAGYDARWGGEIMETLAVEREFALPLINPQTGEPSRTWMRAGKIDAIASLWDGSIAIVEHKTSSDAVDVGEGSDYRSRLTLDGQVSQYFDGADALGFPAEKVLYDVLVKPRQMPLEATPLEARKYTKGKAATKNKPAEEPRLHATQRERDETMEEYRARLVEAIASDPDYYFVRSEIVRLERDRDAYAFDVWQTTQLMDLAMTLDLAPMNPDACHRYGSRCPFWDVCTGTASLDDPERFTRLENVHAELNVTAAAPTRAA